MTKTLAGLAALLIESILANLPTEEELERDFHDAMARFDAMMEN